MFTVTTPASDKTLLTAAELRDAVGVTDNSKDSQLAAIGASVALSIARYCNVSASGVTEPTLRSETITETWRLGGCVDFLIPARRFVSSITSVTVNGAVIAADGYEIDPATSIIYRLADDVRTQWEAGKIVIVYVAGFSTVPSDLKTAAAKFVSEIYSTGTRDPNLKRLKIEGVSEREYWVPPTTDPLISQEVADLLFAYRNHVVA